MAVTTNPPRIDFKVSPEEKACLSGAAKRSGKTMTRFILDQMLPEAERILAEENKLQLSRKDWESFCERLDNPRSDLKGLKRLLSEPSVFVDE